MSHGQLSCEATQCISLISQKGVAPKKNGGMTCAKTLPGSPCRRVAATLCPLHDPSEGWCSYSCRHMLQAVGYAHAHFSDSIDRDGGVTPIEPRRGRSLCESFLNQIVLLYWSQSSHTNLVFFPHLACLELVSLHLQSIGVRKLRPK